MGAKTLEYIKWAATIVVVLLAVAVIAAAVTHSRRAGGTADTGKPEGAPKELEGLIENAYILSSEGDSVTVHFAGEEYTLKGRLESAYVGVADLEVADGRILQVSAKTAAIEGTLDRYTEELVQISGYEELLYSGELPVYVLQEDVFVGEKKLTDLIIGTSQIRLIVAKGRACAVIQHRGESFENIRVLLKNKDDIFYGNLYVTSPKKYTVDGKKKKGDKVTNVKTAMKDCKAGDEICISPGDDMLYLCDREGERIGEGYEGEFLVRKLDEGYVLVNELPIETYLRYVVPSEMPTRFSYEALKAQAVCARTFAYKQMQGSAYAEYGANLDDSTSYQVYHAASTYEVTDQAVLDTEGIVLTSDGGLIDCYYYSTSPGYSENLDVWNASSPDYLVAENHTKEKKKDLSDDKVFHKFINDEPEAYDDASPYYRWTAELSAENGMDEEYGKLRKITVNERSASGYIRSLTVTFEDGERTYDRENDIRFALGKYVSAVTLADGSVRTAPGSVPSACFEVEEQKDGVIKLRGGGFGHGIGMSQYGADGMGQEGKSWQEILSFYYKGVEIQNQSE